MSTTSKIEWTDHSFSPWYGCAHASPGCAHCYAEAWADRFGKAVWGTSGTRVRAADSTWRHPLSWQRTAARDGVRRRVFCAHYCDLFEDHPLIDPAWRAGVWALIERTPSLDWLLLTKRPQNAVRMVPPDWLTTWPANVWMGTTAEDQRRANERLPVLLTLPAPVRFVSAEPLLEPLDLTPWLGGLHWVIAGGESNQSAPARPCNPEWIRSIVRQCQAAGVAVFVKQLGDNTGGLIHLRHRKGGDMDEWPADLRVREIPEPTHA